MENSVRRKLNLLDNMIGECFMCTLCQNGRTKPYWTEDSNYVIIGEAPGRDEVENNEPFVGKAGSILWKLMEKHGFQKEQFLIINSVNCRPMDGKKNGKPTPEQMTLCKKWLNMYLKVLMPLRGMMLGSYAQQTITNESSNSVVLSNSAVVMMRTESLTVPFIPMIRSVHPAYSIYSPKGEELLEESILKFKLFRGIDE